MPKTTVKARRVPKTLAMFYLCGMKRRASRRASLSMSGIASMESAGGARGPALHSAARGEPGRARIAPRRPGQSVLDGDAHVRGAQLGQDGAVLQLDESVDGALGVDEDVELGRLEVEEPAGRDELGPLVHQGRRVHRHLPAHDPAGMAKSFLERFMREG